MGLCLSWYFRKVDIKAVRQTVVHDFQDGDGSRGSMLQAYFALGGFHVQFNTISNEVLKDAQEHPENYKDLLVRVAGYSTQFVNLSRSMQESIMARNAHGEF